jgi:hypothetical protein
MVRVAGRASKSQIGKAVRRREGEDRLHARIIAWEPGKFRDEGVYLGVFCKERDDRAERDRSGRSKCPRVRLTRREEEEKNAECGHIAARDKAE